MAVPIAPPLGNYPAHPSGIPRFSPLPRKYDYSSRRTVNNYTLVLTGWTVTIEHFLAAAAILDQTAPAMMEAVGEIGVKEAQRLVPFDTGATHDSIQYVTGEQSGTFGFRVPGMSVWTVEMGAMTFYAPFLEFGTVRMQARPFMGPAYDVMTAALIGSVQAILGAVLSTGGGSLGGAPGPAGSVMSSDSVKAPFSSFRSFLYTSAKALGDVSILGGRGVFGNIRGQMYGMAKLMGDVSAGMTGVIGQRVSHRLKGRLSGRMLGVGSASMSHGMNYSAFVGGALGHRVYQRFAGAQMKGFAFGSGGLSMQRFLGH